MRVPKPAAGMTALRIVLDIFLDVRRTVTPRRFSGAERRPAQAGRPVGSVSKNRVTSTRDRR